VSISIAVDTARTFSVIILMGVEPKLDFNTKQQQKTKDGILKWAVSVAAQTVAVNGQRSTAETMSVTVAAPANPVQDLPPGTPVVLENLYAGATDPEHNEKGGIRGGKLFWQASGVTPLVAASSGRS